MSETLWAVIIGGVIATVAPIVVEAIRGSREATLDKERRADNRRIDRDGFQRATLLELMSALAHWKDVVTRAFTDRLTRYHEAEVGRWPMGWSDELNAEMDAAETRITVLREPTRRRATRQGRGGRGAPCATSPVHNSARGAR